MWYLYLRRLEKWRKQNKSRTNQNKMAAFNVSAAGEIDMVNDM